MTEETKDPQAKQSGSTVDDNLWDKVDYVYSSFQQIAINPLEVRLIFGDRLPPEGKQVRPLFGIVMTHVQARAFHKALSLQLEQLRETVEKAKQQRAEKAAVEKPAAEIQNGN